MVDSSILKVDGKDFRCSECGCKLFHKGELKGEWICNGCGRSYGDETYEAPRPKRTIFEMLASDPRKMGFILSEIIQMDDPPFNDYVSALKWLLQKTEL